MPGRTDGLGLTRMTTCITRNGPVGDRKTLTEAETAFGAMSAPRNRKGNRFFPGFFTISAQQDQWALARCISGLRNWARMGKSGHVDAGWVWLGQSAKHDVAADLLASAGRLAVASEVIERVLNGRLVISADGAERPVPGLFESHAGAADFPWRSLAAWIGARLARRHRLDPCPAIAAARSVFRSDLCRPNLYGTGAELAGASDELEGSLSVPTAAPASEGRLILSPGRFFDARIFDPADPLR